MIDRELMRYDKMFHRFVLTPKGAGMVANVAKIYGTEEKILYTLSSISSTIYNYIYSRNAAGNKAFIEYRLAKDEELEQTIFEAMLAQLRADISSGYDDVKNQVGINFKTNTKIKEEDIINRMVCPETKLILEEQAEKIMTTMFLSRLYPSLPHNRYEAYDY